MGWGRVAALVVAGSLVTGCSVSGGDRAAEGKGTTTSTSRRSTTTVEPDPSTTAPADDRTTTTTTFVPEPDAEGTLLRLSTGADHTEYGELSLLVDGRVVQVRDTSVLRSVDDFRTWRITPATVAEVFDVLGEANMLPSPDDVSVFGEYGDPATEAVQRLLTDEANFVGPPEPWVPDKVSIEVRPFEPDGDPYGPNGSYRGVPAAWPLATPVVQLQLRPDEMNGGDIACLTGEDAAAVFGLVTREAGYNTAYLPVEDDGTIWLLDLGLRYPGYHVYGDPCP